MISRVLIAVAVAATVLEAEKQDVTVMGTVMCHGRSLAYAHVELWEHDSLDPDDLLASTVSDASVAMKT
ncbi:hypothetical protein PMAYCL1PPCAC_20069, partial [Pristionchus mayeri]